LPYLAFSQAAHPDDPAAHESAIAAWRQWRSSQGK